jgi:hypothetical protein
MFIRPAPKNQLTVYNETISGNLITLSSEEFLEDDLFLPRKFQRIVKCDFKFRDRLNS